MLKLNETFPDSFEYNGKIYALDLCFDNVLDMFEAFHEHGLDIEERVLSALSLLIGVVETDKLSISQQFELLFLIMDKFFKGKERPVPYDVLGNPMINKKTEADFSLEYDAEYIYVSFMQAYQIDLHKEFGKMHWNKFMVLLNNLPPDSKLNRIREIRNWEPSGDETSEEKRKMAELQELYALPEQREGDED